LEGLFRRRLLRGGMILRIVTVAMRRGPVMGSSDALFVVRIILACGVSRDSLQGAALHGLKGAFSLRCHSRNLWVRRIDVRILNYLFPFKEVILELFEGF
jgi:hypothetical protein